MVRLHPFQVILYALTDICIWKLVDHKYMVQVYSRNSTPWSRFVNVPPAMAERNRILKLDQDLVSRTTSSPPDQRRYRIS